MWFQNRRAKFRRNERNILAQRNTLYGGGRPPVPEPSSPEQPIIAAARPTQTGHSEYLSWPPAASYSAMTNNSYCSMTPNAMTSSPPTLSSCAVAGNSNYSAPPGVGVGTSIASLRLKAREYNMGYAMPPQMTQ